MKTQMDQRTRIVALANLHAMCERASGMCHRYEVSKVSRSRVHVTYSNPDEYGNDRPVTAVFPALPGFAGDPDNLQVVIGKMLRTIGGTDEYDYQAFDAIVCSPVLYRYPSYGMDEWSTRQETDGTNRYLCPDGQTRTVNYSHPYTNETFAAFNVSAETPAETFARIGGNRHFAYFVWSDLRPVKE